jgi:hypothetical protein
VGYVVDKVELGQFFSECFGFSPCQFHSTGAPLAKAQKIIIIFIIGLHNKPQGCSASVASAAGPFATKKKHVAVVVTIDVPILAFSAARSNTDNTNRTFVPRQ